MQYGTSLTISAASALLLIGCAQNENRTVNVPAAPEPAASGVQDYPVKLGAPYKIGNATYTPEDVALYDEVGYASWYGAELEGRPTANGETFVSGGVSAAHKTLPLPSYVEVTSLDTGRTIIVRVNDRGPFATDRLIDLSDGAARQLGITGQGVAGVRVRRVNPPEQDKAALRSGVAAPTRMDTPESLLKVLRDKLGKLPQPTGNDAAPPIAAEALRAADEKKATTATRTDGRFVREGGRTAPTKAAVAPAPTVIAPAPGSYVVQMGAFSSQSRAKALADKVDAKVEASSDGRIYRVRFGPFVSESEAQAALDRIRKRGYPQARMLRQ
jgi:rare lipoprotein A